jgi:hypothetical protein
MNFVPGSYAKSVSCNNGWGAINNKEYIIIITFEAPPATPTRLRERLARHSTGMVRGRASLANLTSSSSKRGIKNCKNLWEIKGKVGVLKIKKKKP